MDTFLIMLPHGIRYAYSSSCFSDRVHVMIDYWNQ